jgi:hypothetical protein
VHRNGELFTCEVLSESPVLASDGSRAIPIGATRCDLDFSFAVSFAGLTVRLARATVLKAVARPTVSDEH